MPLAQKIGAHKSWAQTENRTARTANARTAFENRFLEEAGGDPKRAESARKAYYLALAQKSAQARQRRRRIEDEARRQRINALLDTGAQGGDHAVA